MTFKEFYEEHRTIILVVIVIIIILIIYRYFWEGYSFNKDFSTAAMEMRLTNLERNLGLITPPVTTIGGMQPIQVQGSPSCINPDIQNQIANNFSKKLQEINACDCTGACGLVQQQPQQQPQQNNAIFQRGRSAEAGYDNPDFTLESFY